MKKLKELLSQYHEVVSFDDGDIEMLGNIAEEIEMEQGETFFHEHDPSDSVFLVMSGAVDLFTSLNDDLDHTLMTVRSGGFIGIMALISDDSREINARAAEKTKAYRFDRDKLQSLIAEELSLGKKFLDLVTHLLSNRLRIVTANLRENLKWTMQVSGVASLDISQLIVDRVNIVVELVNGKQLNGVIMKAEEHPAGFELFLKTDDGNVHFVPYHAIVSASLPIDSIPKDPNGSLGM